MKRIVIILNSSKNLKPCAKGLKWLHTLAAQGQARVDEVRFRSMLKNLDSLLWLLSSLNEAGDVDVIIAGASAGDNLPVFVDAHLRNLGNTQIKVIGVVFCDSLINALTARLSITRARDTQALYAGAGRAGFVRACHLAFSSKLPKIQPRKPSNGHDLSLYQATILASEV